MNQQVETVDPETGEVKAVATELVPQKKTHVQVLRDLFDSPAMKDQILKALPKHMTAERMLRVAMTAYQRTPSLWECDARSICACIVESSELGLEPNGIIAHAYLVPYNNKNTGVKQAQLMIGYKGLAELALRSPKVLSIYPPEVVYEKDSYSVEKGMDPKLEHKPYIGDGERGKIIAAYAIAKIADQDEKPFVWLTLEDIEKLRSRSKAKDSGPWKTDYAAMCKKSAIRQLCKYLPCRTEEQEAISKDELRDLNIMQGNEFIASPPAAPPPSDRPQNLQQVNEELKARAEAEEEAATTEALAHATSIPPPEGEVNKIGHVAQGVEATEIPKAPKTPVQPDPPAQSPEAPPETPVAPPPPPPPPPPPSDTPQLDTSLPPGPVLEPRSTYEAPPEPKPAAKAPPGAPIPRPKKTGGPPVRKAPTQ